MDLRVEKTRRSIINGFLELRARKPLEKIRVRELCEKAQINKSTFYDHYRDVYDLAEQLEDEAIRSYLDIAHPEYVLTDVAGLSGSCLPPGWPASACWTSYFPGTAAGCWWRSWPPA